MTVFRMSARGRTTVLVLTLDVLSPLAALAWVGFLRTGDPAGMLLRYPWLILTALTFPLALGVAELYSPRGSWWAWPTALRVAGAALVVVVLFGGAHAVVAERRELPLLFGPLAAAMVSVAFGARAVIGFGMRRERGIRRAVVVGAGWAGRAVIDCTLFEPRLRIRIVGAVDDDLMMRNSHYKGVPVVGTGADLLDAVARHDADLVIVAIPRAQKAEAVENLVRLSLRGVEIVDMPAFVERVTGQIPIRNAEGAWLVYGIGFESLSHSWRGLFKRALDGVVAAAALLLALPLLALIALLVRLGSPGAIFFPQERAGRGERPIHLFKFRTMEEVDGGAGLRTYRLTRVGRLLRRTHLDELPQFFNVLRGDVSFVGPRPERTVVADRLAKAIPFYALRLSVPPGLTGWAQVQHRFGTALEEPLERLKYDLYYIKNMSFRLDLFVLLKTLKLVFFQAGR